jgi:hypothetical protein
VREEGLTIAVAVNDLSVLQQNLLLSPGLLNNGRHELLIKRGFRSASLAYNSALDEAKNDTIVFVHQDIYLPDTWFADLRRCIRSLDRAGARWGVLGCFGSRRGAVGGLGRVYTNGMGRHGRVLSEPEPVETLDEIVLVMRRSSGLRFDVRLPHFHLYGTDICMEAREQGMSTFAFQGFCVHNTRQLLTLPAEFYESYRYLRRKWRHALPIYASCITFSPSNGPFYWRRLRELSERFLGARRVAKTRLDDPRVVLDPETESAHRS